jgi:FlaA1/EpsC-like NDP-sugar epimerase
MKPLIAFARQHLPIVHFVVDSALWAIAIPVGVFLRYDFAVERLWRSEVFVAVGVAVLLQGVLGQLTGLYRRRWRYGSFDEARAVAMTALAVGVILTAVWWQTGAEPPRAIPRSVPLLATGVSMLGQLAIRSTWRLYVESRRRPSGDHLMRVVVVGAGEGAHQVLRTLNSSTDSPYLPVAMVDDDRSKRNLRMSGVRVAGTVDDLLEVAERHRADTVLIAIPSAPTSFYRHVHDLAQGAGLTVLVLPAVDQLLDRDGGVGVSDIRPVNECDLLGRRPADIDPAAVAGYITGRRVLVTGAGGSIGSEICRQLAGYEPAALVMLDRDESGLHGTQLLIEGRAMLDDPNLVLADIRDRARIEEVFAEHRPDVVFHAAALKHLPLLEMYPSEAWKTNVGGTLILLDAARRHGVSRFVNISTDKAADPTSVLGWTKRITERLTAHTSMLGSIECMSVRFGNVLGSSGSVLKAFEAQAKRGGPITVTDPAVTRYFMTIAEASRLTIYAGAIGDPGEIMILDMGEPVKIVEVAERFANQHDPPLEIVFTGLRSNEKLHEDLFSTSEHGERRIHKMITHVSVRPLDPRELTLSGPTPTADEMRAIALLESLDDESFEAKSFGDDTWSTRAAAATPPDTFDA